uniref:Secreted protein n=1 Tax=Astatotilapia calliptera TaxID=8154 RepID=A0AAX7UJ70_ASTCA
LCFTVTQITSSSQPNSSLVLAASCLSMSAAMLSAIWNPSSPTCFSTSRIVSSECASFAFLTCVTALERTLLSESLALLPSCLATLARFSLCSRVTLQGNGKNVRNERDRLTSGKLLMLTIMKRKKSTISSLPGEVRMLRFRVKSSLSESRTVVMSSFTSSRLMMSSTRDELMFTFPDWPFALALKIKREKEGKNRGKT